MGLIQKISESKKFETKEISIILPVEKKQPDRPNACHVCKYAEFWIDVYGGGPHCSHCSPPPSRAMIKEEILARPKTDAELDREFEQRYVSYEIPEKRDLDGDLIRPARLIIQRRDFSFIRPIGMPAT